MVALDKTGRVHEWGKGSGFGKLAELKVLTPQPVEGLENIVAVEDNDNTPLALDSAGRVWTWVVGQAGSVRAIRTPVAMKKVVYDLALGDNGFVYELSGEEGQEAYTVKAETRNLVAVDIGHGRCGSPLFLVQDTAL